MFQVTLKTTELWLRSAKEVGDLLLLIRASDDNKVDERNTGDNFNPVVVTIY